MKLLTKYCVLVDTDDLANFAKTWPCSGLGDAIDTCMSVWFEFDGADGDLVDYEWADANGDPAHEPEGIDGSALQALSQDAQQWLIVEDMRALRAEWPHSMLDGENFNVTNEHEATFRITEAQAKSLRRVYGRNTDGAPTFGAFVRRAVTAFGGDCVMLHWCGMWLGIEKDGYTHS